MKKLIPHLFFVAFFFFLLPRLYAQSNQTVNNGQMTAPVNFTGGCTYTWTNSNPSIGLPASGTGNIPAFTAVNTGNTPVTATITATPTGASYAYAYIASASDGTIDVINTINNTIAGTIQLPSDAGPWGVTASPDGTRIYIACSNNNTIVTINTSTNKIINTITGILFPYGVVVSPDGNYLYVTQNTSNLVLTINIATNKVVATLKVGTNPTNICVSPDGKTLYVTDSNSDAVSIIDVSSNSITSTINFSKGDNINNLCLSPDGSILYVTLGAALAVINTANNSTITNIPLGYAQIGISVSADGSTVYVANANSDDVSVINAAKNTLITTIPVGTQPEGTSLSVDGSYLYVENYRSNSVSVISTATNLVIATIPVVPYPLSTGIFTVGANCNSSPITFTITVNPTSPPTITTTTPTGTISACAGTPSADPNVEQFNASGTNLTGDITVTAPTGFEVSRDIGGPYSSSLTLTQTLGTVGSSLVFVRSAATAPSGNIPPGTNVTLSSPGATDQTVALSGTIYSIPSASTPASQVKINGQPTDPVNFTGNASSYTWVNNNTSIGLAASGTGNIPSFTAINNTGSPVIATLTVTPVNGSDCNGTPDEFYITVDPTPTILTASGTLNPLTTVYGTASAAESFTVSCSTIGAQILVTPPPGFEVSSDGTTFSSTVTITNKESNSPVTVYIRLAASDHVKNYSGDVVISTANATNATITIPVSTVTPAVLTITADNKTKPYGAADPPLTVTYSGFVNNDGPAQLTALPVLTTIATTASAVGQYAINVGGAFSPDYTPAYNAGILTVTPSLTLQDIPNTFTPNGDGRNDTWVINGLEYYPAATVNIFNRWGQKLYYSLGYPIPWDGMYHGKALPSGTYYFIIDLKNKQPKIAGWVAIVR